MSKLDKFVEEHTKRAEAIGKVRKAKTKFNKYSAAKDILNEAKVVHEKEWQDYRSAKKSLVADLRSRNVRWPYSSEEYKNFEKANEELVATNGKIHKASSKLRKFGPSSGIEAHSIPVDDKVVKFGKRTDFKSRKKMEHRGQKKMILSEQGVTPDAHIVKTSNKTYIVADKMDVDRDKIKEIAEWRKAGLSRKAKEYGAPIDDLHRGNFGLTDEGGLRIIDAGFDKMERPPTPDMDEKIVKRTISKNGDAFRKLSGLTKHLPLIGGLTTAASVLSSPSVEAAGDTLLEEADPFGILLPEKVNVGADQLRGGLSPEEAHERYIELLKSNSRE